MGEVIVRNHRRMVGYLRHSEVTAEKLKDGWIHAGDLNYEG